MFLSVSTINSMDDVLGSVIVTERLKTRKSLATNCWRDTISVVEVKSNDRNVKNLWKVSTSFKFCAIFHFKSTFFNSWKIQVSKNLGVGGAVVPPPPPPPPPPVSAGLYHSNISRLMFHRKFLQSVNFVMKDGGFANT